MKKKTVIEMGYNELDQLISKEFGIDYECVPYEEWNNDESHQFNVEAESMDAYDLKKFAKQKYDYMTRSLLNELCFRGKIEAGEYIVKVSW